jgi:transposase
MASPKPPYLLTVTQMRRLAPHFPLSHGVPRVDDRRVLSGIIYVIRHGLQWRDAARWPGPCGAWRHPTHAPWPSTSNGGSLGCRRSR